MKFTADELRGLEILEGLSEDQIGWFCEHGTKMELAPGDHMLDKGQPADFMFLVVEGTVQGYEEVGGELLHVATTGRGDVTGMLPFSRMTHYPRYAAAVEPSQVLRLAKTDFQEMLNVSLKVGERLVAKMSDRVRGDVRLEQQREKMIALGKLSAGLAHELNNPAAAVDRAAAALSEKLATMPGCIRGLVRQRLDDEAMDAIHHLPALARARSREPTHLSSLQRGDREDELAAWLEERGIDESWRLAGTFADAGLGVDDLKAVARVIPEAALADALVWSECALTAERTVAEIASSSERISSLIASVKTYSHMDRSSDHKPTDVRQGIDNTLRMLGHKLEKKAIRLARVYQEDLPAIPAHAGELNQVWTNLIDNAIDAMQDGGELRIEASQVDMNVVVCVIDDGCGIPRDLQVRVFEPFFTTKEVGEGTGLGLDIALRIVRTHQGRIDVTSEPGHTEMRVELPVSRRVL